MNFDLKLFLETFFFKSDVMLKIPELFSLITWTLMLIPGNARPVPEGHSFIHLHLTFPLSIRRCSRAPYSIKLFNVCMYAILGSLLELTVAMKDVHSKTDIFTVIVNLLWLILMPPLRSCSVLLGCSYTSKKTHHKDYYDVYHWQW